LLGELFDSTVSKLESCLFLSIDRDKIGFYATDDIPHFGKDVDKAIPKSTYHVAEAGRCYALERWDACVHHLMLAVEEALKKWACNLKLKMDRPLILSNWESILNAARTRLRTLKNQPKTSVSDRKIQRIGETLAHFEAIKEAWRNHCQHGRDKYDERRARNLFSHVETFMQHLAMTERKQK